MVGGKNVPLHTLSREWQWRGWISHTSGSGQGPGLRILGGQQAKQDLSTESS